MVGCIASKTNLWDVMDFAKIKALLLLENEVCDEIIYGIKRRLWDAGELFGEEVEVPCNYWEVMTCHKVDGLAIYSA
jgi:hypothetical protein